MSKEFYNIEEVCAKLKCAPSTVYRWIAQDEFPEPVKFGRMARWTSDDLNDFLDVAVQRRNDAGPRPAAIRRGRPPFSPT